MKFAAKRNDLLDALSAISGTVEKRTTIPILSHVLIRAENGALHLSATDLELSMRTSCAAQVEAGGAATAPLAKLAALAKLLPSDAYVSVRTLENKWTEIACGGNKYKMVGHDVAHFPTLPEPKAEYHDLPAAALRKLIERTLFAVSAEESRYTLNGSLLVFGNYSLRMVATDGHRMSLADAPCGKNGLSGEVLVPLRALSELSAMLQGLEPGAAVGFARDESHLFFRANGRTLAARLLTGKFPNYEAVLPKANDVVFSAPCDALVSSLSRISEMADVKTHGVKFSLSTGELTMTGSSPEYGDAIEKLAVEWDGKPVAVGFNAEYLLDFLRAAPPGPVKVKLKDEASAAELDPAAGDPWRYVVMPLAIR